MRRPGDTITARGLSVEIGQARLLNELSFALPAGELTVILGPNGAGKTTTLLTLTGVLLLFFGAIGTIGAGLVKVDFFAADTIRLYYVNVEMPPETPLELTLAKVREIERKVKQRLREGEARAVISYAGNMFTETAPRLGDHVGQIMIGLNPKTEALRSVQQMIEDMRADLLATPGPLQVSFLRLAGGPPTAKPISIKVRGDDYAQIRAAADVVRAILAESGYIIDIQDDASKGRNELVLRLDADAINRAGLNPLEINRTLQLLVDGVLASRWGGRGR